MTRNPHMYERASQNRSWPAGDLEKKRSWLKAWSESALAYMLLATGLLGPATGIAGSALAPGAPTSVVVEGIQTQIDFSKLLTILSGIITELLVIQSYLTRKRANPESLDPTLEANITELLTIARQYSKPGIDNEQLLRVAVIGLVNKYQANMRNLSPAEQAQVQVQVAQELKAYLNEETPVEAPLSPEQREEVVAEVRRLLGGAAEHAHIANNSNS